MTAIEAHSLEVAYGRQKVLDGLSLQVPAGAIYAFIGPNGAGKTTTIRALLGLIRPRAGTVRLSAAGLTEIGHVSESARLPLWMTVEQYMAWLAPFYPTWDTALADELIRQFELPPRRPLKALSRGMRMKAALASTLAFRPKLLFLDEPFSGLDPLVRDELTEGLLAGAGESTVFVSSHDLAEIESFSSHVGYLDQGKLRFSEETSALVERFREVEITVDAAPALPAPWPEAWLAPQSAASVVRFIDSRYDPAHSPQSVARLFPHARAVEAHPMSLRDIFVALARQTRKAA